MMRKHRHILKNNHMLVPFVAHLSMCLSLPQSLCLFVKNNRIRKCTINGAFPANEPQQNACLYMLLKQLCCCSRFSRMGKSAGYPLFHTLKSTLLTPQAIKSFQPHRSWAEVQAAQAAPALCRRGQRLAARIFHGDQAGSRQGSHRCGDGIAAAPCAPAELAVREPVAVLRDSAPRYLFLGRLLSSASRFACYCSPIHFPAPRLAENNEQDPQLGVPQARHHRIHQPGWDWMPGGKFFSPSRLFTSRSSVRVCARLDPLRSLCFKRRGHLTHPIPLQGL